MDRNRYKNLTLDKAAAQGIAAARLPIGKYMKLASSKVLTVNHVLSILLNYAEVRENPRQLARAFFRGSMLRRGG